MFAFRAVRTAAGIASTLPRAGFDASALVVTFAPGMTYIPEGTVTPGPTRANAPTIAPALIVAPSITALGPIPVGLELAVP